MESSCRQALAIALAMLVIATQLENALGQRPTPAVPPGSEAISPDVLGTPSPRPLPNGPPADALTGPVYEGNTQADFANLPVGPGVVEGMCPMPSPWRCGVYCGTNQGACANQTWENSRPIPWQVFAQGEYIGPAAYAARARISLDGWVTDWAWSSA